MKRTKNFKKDGKELFYLDLFKTAYKRRKRIREYFGEYLSELNSFLYNLNFEALDKFWVENAERSDRTKPYTEHFKDNPRWKQLQAIEKYLAEEYTLINYTNKDKIVPCKDCKYCEYKKLQNSFKWVVDEKECNKMIESEQCPNIKIIKTEL